MAGKEPPKAPSALPGARNESEAPPKKSSKVKKIIIIILILLITLGGAGAGTYWWFVLRPATRAADMEGAPPPDSSSNATAPKNSGDKTENSPLIERQSSLPRSTGKVLPLPEFIVNLSDPAGKRYLKLGMEVEVNADVSQSLNAQSAKVRDAVIMLLAGKTFADVSSAEGKVLLKAEVAGRLNQILGGQYVVRVYFTEFVVQ